MKKCEYCGKQGAPLGGINIDANQSVDFFVYEKSIAVKVRGKTAFDAYVPIRFCPVCGKKVKGAIP